MAIIATPKNGKPIDITSFKTNSIEQVRYGCAIGAMQSVAAIPRAIPITHCGPGCADKQFMNLAFYNGFQGGGYGGGAVIPSTNASEREVVFGGAARLNELVESSLKILALREFVWAAASKKAHGRRPLPAQVLYSVLGRVEGSRVNSPSLRAALDTTCAPRMWQ